MQIGRLTLLLWNLGEARFYFGCKPILYSFHPPNKPTDWRQ